ncbi:hypothetical protein T439DRAFT_10495 [Meredithblackwellia eburnea MCA 4105]
MPVQLILRSIPDGKVIKKFDSDQGTIKIGRGPRDSSDTLRLNSGRFRGDGTKVMSQSHASLSWEGGDSYKVPMLTDTKSTNGTWVERAGDATQLRPKVPYRLKQDDVITFGKQMDSRQSRASPQFQSSHLSPYHVTLSRPSADLRSISSHTFLPPLSNLLGSHCSFFETNISRAL